MDTIDRIFKMLAKSGLSQIELADKLGIKKNAISQWKSRVSKSYTKRLPQIAEVLGTTVQWLVTGEELPPQSQPPPPVAGDGRGRNIVRAAGRDGSYIERTLTDEQLAAIKAIINQLPDATDL